MQDIIDKFAERIRSAAAAKRPLRICGGGTKDFYGGALNGELLVTTPYAGVVDYEPTELVMTVRSGTTLAEVERVLEERGQMLPFEPPRFGPASTIGGMVAAGLSGPRRPYAGAVRDLVLGVRIIDGAGRDLRFGGQVMKNVAGYDVARVMAGALGTLGVILDVSVKVLPKPPAEATLRFEHKPAAAIATMNEWAGKPLPISATCFVGDSLYVRLSGAEPAVRASRSKLGGDDVADGSTFWDSVRDQQHAFFAGAGPLWRLSIKSTTPPLDVPGPQLIEWNGALRWLAADADPALVRRLAAGAGGHATLFRGGETRAGAFQPLPPPLMKIQRRLKAAFDPHGILNPARLYPEL